MKSLALLLVFQYLVINLQKPAFVDGTTTTADYNDTDASTEPPQVTFAPKKVHEAMVAIDRILETYDKNVSPLVFNGEQIQVRTKVEIQEFREISDQLRQFKARMVLTMTWLDSRLNYSKFGLQDTEISIRNDFINEFWKPDIAFSPVRDAFFHVTSSPNMKLSIEPDGEVTVSGRYSATFGCNTDLVTYPFDSKVCKFDIFPTSYSKNDLLMTWVTENPIILPGRFAVTDKNIKKVFLGSFELSDIRHLKTCTHSFEVRIHEKPKVAPCLRVEFILDRKYVYYIINTFIPSMFIVAVSWIGFWIPSDIVPARVVITSICTLAIAIQSLHQGTSQPRTPYVKSVDVWMAGCFSNIFFVTMEYALVSILLRMEKKRLTWKQAQLVQLNQVALEQTSIGALIYNISEYITGILFSQELSLSEALDRISRYIFPVAFLIFTMVYIIIYLIVN